MKHLQDFGLLLASLDDGCTIVLHSGFAEPAQLARLLADHAVALRGVHLLTMMPMGDAPYGSREATAQMDVATFFPGSGLRTALDEGRVRPLRYPLSAIPDLFASRALRADVLMLQVSPPDETGHVSLGMSVDYMRAVLAQSPTIVAEINPRMPRTCGDTLLHVSQIAWFVEATAGPQEQAAVAPDGCDQQIAVGIAGLLRDGAVLQLGIGSLPDQVLAQLGHLKHLGLHSGIVSDGVRPLIESGVIDNSTKKLFPGVSVASMAGGTQAFYDFLHRNRKIEFHPCSLTHDVALLAGIDGLCAINSALQIDLAGQISAEAVAERRISLPGGLPDFALGASRARAGMSIIALRSSFGSGRTSNIRASLAVGVPVTIPPSVVDFVVTEYGVAPMRGASAKQRAAALISVAHPDHRETLQREFASSGLTEAVR